MKLNNIYLPLFICCVCFLGCYFCKTEIFVFITILSCFFLLSVRSIYLSVLDILILGSFIYPFCHYIAKGSINLEYPLIEYIFYFNLFVLSRNIASRSFSFIVIVRQLLILISVFESVLGICQYLINWELPYASLKMIGTFSNSGILGGFSTLGVILAGEKVISDYRLFRKKNIAFIAAMIICGFSVLLSNSRAAWLSLICASFIYLFEHYKIKSSIKGAFLGGVIFCGIILYFYKQKSADARWFIWKVAMLESDSNLLLGLGVDSFKSSYMDWQSSYFMKYGYDLNEIQYASDNYYAFNEYLKILIEQGFISLALLLLIVILIITNRSKANTALGFRYALINIYVFALFSYPFEIIEYNVVYYILLGGVCSQANSLLRFQLDIKMTMLYCTFLTFYLWLVLDRTAHVNKSLNKELLSSKTVCIEALQLFEAGKMNIEQVDRYAKLLMYKKKYNEAIYLLEASVAHFATPQKCYDLAFCFERTKQYEKAEYYYYYLYNMRPAFIMPKYKLLVLYQEKCDTVKAINIAQEIMVLDVKVRSDLTDRIKKKARVLVHEMKYSN